MWATVLALVIAVAPAPAAVSGHTVAVSGHTNVVTAVAGCPPNEVPNPRGYGCVPALAPGGAVVGAPTEQELSACHGGNLYFCVDPYGGP